MLQVLSLFQKQYPETNWDSYNSWDSFILTQLTTGGSLESRPKDETMINDVTASSIHRTIKSLYKDKFRITATMLPLF